MNTEAMFSKKSDEYGTPIDFFNQLDAEFNFTLDPCATDDNHLCKKYFTKEIDGLSQSWENNTVFCNPPYSNVSGWAKKCADESYLNNITVVMLVPARTDTRWFHQYVYNRAEIRFVKGRLKFNGGDNSAPFPSMVVIFRKR